MEKITKIQEKGARALLFVDGEEKGWLRRATLMELGWNEGDDFDEAAWEEALECPEFRAALEEGARYLASPRRRKEVLKKLKESVYS